MIRPVLGAAAAIAAYSALIALVRPRHMRLGATPQEAAAPMAGDSIVAGAVQSTRAITIDAPSEAVWPWIVQMGQDRAGFYSYDVLERMTGAGIRNADGIVPEWQHLQPGDLMRTYRYVERFEPLGWFVAEVEPERALVVRNKLSTWTWSLQLTPLDDGSRTRLIARTRSAPKSGLGAVTEVLLAEPAHLIMEVGVLRGVKHRAERVATSPAATASMR
jgi:hypothetical protein